MGETMEETHKEYKYISLFILTLQNALLILSMRYSRIQNGDMYITTTAVVLSETLKIIVCLCVLFVNQKCTVRKYMSFLYQSIIVEWKDTLKLSVPALVYMIQNNLQYIAVSNLEAAVFQVTYQLKILTTAFFSVLILKRTLTKPQWGSLLMLFVGVALVQVHKTQSSHLNNDQNQFIGLLAVIVSCLSSGFAGVYMEKMIKHTKASLWLRNLQLSCFGALTALIGMWTKDREAIAVNGFFHGYSFLVLFVIIQQALGGIIVSLVVKYADNILKGFSTSLSIIISCVVSVFLFYYVITLQFISGTVLVLIAIFIYGKFQPPKSDILPIYKPTNHK